MRVLLVIYDNESYTSFFPQGAAYIASALIKAGHTVNIYNQDLYHYSDEHLTDYLNKNYYDMVGIGVIAGYYQYRKLLALTKAVNKAKSHPFLLLGGHAPSASPDFFLQKTDADAIVVGEGEQTIVELCKAKANSQSLVKIKGLVCNVKWGWKAINERRLPQSIDTIEWPAYGLFPIELYRLYRKPHATRTDFVMPILAARGCPYRCSFCYRLEPGYRIRSDESIIEEIRKLQIDYGITYIVFSDELFMHAQTIDRCNAFLKAGLKIKWSCDGRLNYANKVTLLMMKKAGCVFINYGIEAIDDIVLEKMNKKLTVSQIIEGVENTTTAGISPGLNLLWGNIGDTIVTLKKATEFLLKYSDNSQKRTIRPVTPYPGCDLYYHAITKDKLKGVADFYENKHVNSDLLTVNFTDIPDKEFYEALCRANKALLSNYYKLELERDKKQTDKLYKQRDAKFRGYRQT